MLHVPSFEQTALVTDNAALAARVSALFTRKSRYLVVMDGPRTSRPDADNEGVRRRNALVMAGTRSLMLGALSPDATAMMRPGWKNYIVADAYEDIVKVLRGVVKPPNEALSWGPTNLGVGLYRARVERKQLSLDLATSPTVDHCTAGTHLLVACERGDDLAEVLASNLAFASGASFAVFPGLIDEQRDEWLEDLYALGEGGDVTGRFNAISQRARTHLGALDFARYKTALFVTGGFPWGIAVPEVPSTHMYRYPDFGRAIVEGLWATQSAERTARTALLIDPQTVANSEIGAINQALLNNGSLTRVVKGPAATVHRVQALLDLLPHDIIVLSSHAGDAPGDRITYKYVDADGRERRLTVDRALGIGYEPREDKFMVTEYLRFHALDGVNWRDKAGKAALPVGSAITSWSAIGGPMDRNDHIVNQESIPRVVGSMAMKLNDGVWLFASHGFAPGAAPLIVNNSCWSWHELSQRTTFAGARGYVGSLFPIMDAEAQEVGQALFGKYIGQELPQALWSAQQDVYGAIGRRPYVMVGLPFISIRPNTANAAAFMNEAYLDGIAHWSERAANSPHAEIRRNAKRYSNILFEDLQFFRKNLIRRRPPPGR